MLFKRCLEIGSANTIKLINWWHKWAIWAVANGKMFVLLFRCWEIIKSISLIKLTQSNLFRILFIEKNSWGWGGLMKRDLTEMVGN